MWYYHLVTEFPANAVIGYPSDIGNSLMGIVVAVTFVNAGNLIGGHN